MEKLKTIIQYTGVSDCKMEEGSLRCDANISLRPAGSGQLGTKTEIKNLNSFKALYRALSYEVERQTGILSKGPDSSGNPDLGRGKGCHPAPAQQGIRP